MKSNFGARLLVGCFLVAAVACDNGKGKGGSTDMSDGGTGGSGINVTVTIAGEGSVAVNGSTVCTSATDPCTLNVVIGSTTSVTATPGEGFMFSSWNCAGTISLNATLDLVLASGAACTVTFVPISETLTVSISDGRGGTNGGLVTGGVIQCGAGSTNMCSADYDYGTMVTLTAAPFANFEFVGWEGDCATSDLSLTRTFTVLEPMTCIAHFEHIQFPLTLSVVGDGTVFAASPSVSSLATCAQATCTPVDVDSPELVTLTAQPGSGSEITSWTGDCVAAVPTQNVTQVVMDQARTCVVTFGVSDRSLLLATTGGGTITRSPAGTDTGSTFVYPNGTPVTLDAIADANRIFLSWSGCSTSTDSHLVVTMDTDKSCTANFGPAQRTLTVTATGPGGVTSAPAGINTSASDTTQGYDHGTPVTLTATPNSGFEVAAWGGDCANSTTPVPTTFDLTMDANKTCTVTFKARLTVVVVGSGSVTSVAAGINTTAGAYDALFTPDAVVTLTATVNTGGPQVSFLGWSGDCSGTGPSTMVTVSTAKSCTATFTITPYDLTVAVAPTGGGNVVGQRNGAGSTVVNCGTGGSDCGDAAVPSNEFVRLTATAAAGYRFDAWSGCATDATATLDVPMNNNKTCTANFTKQWTVTLTTLTGNGTVTIDRGSTGTSPDKTCAAGSCAQIVDSDETTTVTAIPANSETLVSAFTCSAGTKAGNVYTIANPSANVTCTVTFAPKTITVVGAGTNGSVSPASTTVNSGGTGVQLTATANANYHFTGWSGTFSSGSGTAAGCTGSSNPITVSISGATNGATYTCTAAFAINNVTIIGAANANGTVAPASTATTVGATATTLTATPSTNYQVSGWAGLTTMGTATATGCTGSATTTPVQITAGTQSAAYTCTASFSRIQRNVAVTIAGGANGDVDSSPAGINNCSSTGGTCSSSFDQGDNIVLTATPNANYQVAWTTTSGGVCDGTVANPSGQVKTMTFSNLQNAKACTATWSPIGQTIAVTVVGTSGSVSSTPTGVNTCTSAGGANCSSSFSQGTNPVLTATPNTNFQVTWSTTSGGVCDGTVANPSGQVKTMSFTNLQASKACTATFTPLQKTIAVTVIGANGTVASTPTGINACTSTSGSCSASFDQGSGPALAATPSTNFQVAWTTTSGGVCDGTVTTSGQTKTMTFTNLQAAKACTATFTAIRHTIAVTVVGANGSVASTPTGINACTSSSGTCSALFDQATNPTITATPNTNYQVAFTTTSGGVCDGSVTSSGQNKTMTFTNLQAAKACTATFTILKHAIAVTVVGANGSVSSSPTGINTCNSAGGANCTSTFDQASGPALIATPSANNQVLWTTTSGGVCDGTVTISGDVKTMTFTNLQNAKACTATFSPKQWTVSFSVGTGGTSVTGVAASGTCNTTSCTVNHATNLTLTGSASATPAPGYRFLNWSGSGCGFSTNGQTVSITSNQTCVANFIPRVTVTVNATPSGAGTQSGSGTYDINTTVSISTSPNNDFQFRGWSNCTSSSSTSTSITTPSTGPTSITCTANYNTLWARSYGEPNDVPKSTEYRDSIRGIAVLDNDSLKPSFGVVGTLDLYSTQSATTIDRLAPVLALPETGIQTGSDPARQGQYSSQAAGIDRSYPVSLYGAANADFDSRGDIWGAGGGVTMVYDDKDKIFEKYVRPTNAANVFESFAVGFRGSSSVNEIWQQFYPVGDSKGYLSNFFTGMSSSLSGYFFGGVAHDPVRGGASLLPRLLNASAEDGAEIWDRELCGKSTNFGSTALVAVERATDEGLVGVATVTYKFSETYKITTLIFKLTRTGKLAWVQLLNPTDTNGFALIAGTSIKMIPGGSTFLVSGAIYDNKVPGYRPFISEISDDGDKASIKWSSELETQTSRSGMNLNVYSTISTDSRGAVLTFAVDGEFGATRFKLDGGPPSGIDWQYTYGRIGEPTSTEAPFAIAAVPSNGGYLIGGYSTDPSGQFTQGGWDMCAVRIDDLGETGDPVSGTGFQRRLLDLKVSNLALSTLATDCDIDVTPEPPALVDWSFPMNNRNNKHKTQAGAN